MDSRCLAIPRKTWLTRPVHVAGAATPVVGNKNNSKVAHLPPERAKFISARTIAVDTTAQTGNYGNRHCCPICVHAVVVLLTRQWAA